MKKLEAPSGVIEDSRRLETLLDMCRTAWRLKQRATAVQCLQLVQDAGSATVSPLLRTKAREGEGMLAAS